MGVFEVKPFKIIADSQQEADELSKALGWFVDSVRRHGVNVTAKRASEAIRKWESNPLVKSRILSHFKNS